MIKRIPCRPALNDSQISANIMHKSIAISISISIIGSSKREKSNF